MKNSNYIVHLIGSKKILVNDIETETIKKSVEHIFKEYNNYKFEDYTFHRYKHNSMNATLVHKIHNTQLHVFIEELYTVK